MIEDLDRIRIPRADLQDMFPDNPRAQRSYEAITIALPETATVATGAQETAEGAIPKSLATAAALFLHSTGIGVWEAITAAAVRTALNLDALYLKAASNLSDVANAATARTNLGAVGTARLINAGTGLTGGGDLSADRTLSLSVTTASGVYTPTLTNTANLDSSTAFQCQYLRVGSVVTVSGRIDVDTTAAATLTTLGISLPIASNIGAFEDCSGTASANGIQSESAAIIGDAVNDRATMQWFTTTTVSHAMFFTFTYRII